MVVQGIVMYSLVILTCLAFACEMFVVDKQFGTETLCKEAFVGVPLEYQSVLRMYGIQSINWTCLKPEELKNLLERNSGTKA